MQCIHVPLCAGDRMLHHHHPPTDHLERCPDKSHNGLPSNWLLQMLRNAYSENSRYGRSGWIRVAWGQRRRRVDVIRIAVCSVHPLTGICFHHFYSNHPSLLCLLVLHTPYMDSEHCFDLCVGSALALIERSGSQVASHGGVEAVVSVL